MIARVELTAEPGVCCVSPRSTAELKFAMPNLSRSSSSGKPSRRWRIRFLTWPSRLLILLLSLAASSNSASRVAPGRLEPPAAGELVDTRGVWTKLDAAPRGDTRRTREEKYVGQQARGRAGGWEGDGVEGRLDRDERELTSSPPSPQGAFASVRSASSKQADRVKEHPDLTHDPLLTVGPLLLLAAIEGGPSTPSQRRAYVCPSARPSLWPACPHHVPLADMHLVPCLSQIRQDIYSCQT